MHIHYIWPNPLHYSCDVCHYNVHDDALINVVHSVYPICIYILYIYFIYAVWGKRLHMLSEQPGSFTFGLVASSENDLSDRITIKCILEGIYIWAFIMILLSKQ